MRSLLKLSLLSLLLLLLLLSVGVNALVIIQL